MSSGFDERELAIARLYAGATLELAEAAGASESVLEELGGLAELLERDPNIERALSSPLVDTEVRRELLETALRGRASDLVVNSLQVMNRKGRLSLLRAFIEGYRREFEAMKGITEVELVVAEPLSTEQRTRAQQVAEKWTGGPVRLLERVDSEIIGGLIFKAGDRKLNRSVSRELDIMASRLFDRASEHVQSLTPVDN